MKGSTQLQAIGHRHRKTKRWEAAVWAVLLGTAHLAEAAPDPRATRWPAHRELVVAWQIVNGKKVRLFCKARVLVVVKVDTLTIGIVLDETVFFVMTVEPR